MDDLLCVLEAEYLVAVTELDIRLEELRDLLSKPTQM